MLENLRFRTLLFDAASNRLAKMLWSKIPETGTSVFYTPGVSIKLFFLLGGCIQLAPTIYRTGFHSREEKFDDFRAQLTQILPYL